MPSAKASSRPSGNATPEIEGRAIRATLAPLAEREFRLLFLGRTVSFIGNAFATTALAFAVLDVTGSKADLGYVLAARSVQRLWTYGSSRISASGRPRSCSRIT